jgi:hypothetical protein
MAQQMAEAPHLVVSIAIDQLRGDYLQYFNATFGEKGFKRLMNEGLCYKQVEFGFPNINESSALATIYTGTYPFYHGIGSETRYEVDQQREVSIVADKNYMGNYTSDKFSPLVLLCSTLGDELKIATDGQSNVFAVAPNADEAILSAGRYANAAFWLDNYNGKWATTTYYKDIPWFVDRFNNYEAIGNFSDKSWSQMYSSYRGFPYYKNVNAINYKFSKSDLEYFVKIKQTPIINEQITSLASRFIESGTLGAHTLPDLLMLTYYAGDYKMGKAHSDYGYEVQDIYARLDRELEHLFEAIDRKVGLKNTIIVVTSTGYYEYSPQTSDTYKPFGEFYFNRCTALLNMFLMATYGQANWVAGSANNQIYLNRKLIEEKQVNYSEMLAKAADFVAQFSGVQDVTTLGDWMVDHSGNSAFFRRGMNKKYSGDLFIELQPGWKVVKENTNSRTIYEKNTAIVAPLFFLGENIKKGQVTRKVKATEIAPTMSYILRIRPPNGTQETPLQEFIIP